MQPTPEPEDMCTAVNHKLNKIRSLKRQNQIREQQEFVSELKEKYGSYRDLKKISGIPLKTLHGWCAIPKNREHRGTLKANLKRQEFTNFLMQNTISYSHPCKKYAGKKFLMHTLNDIYKRY